jgi:MgtC family
MEDVWQGMWQGGRIFPIYRGSRRSRNSCSACCSRPSWGPLRLSMGAPGQGGGAADPHVRRAGVRFLRGDPAPGGHVHRRSEPRAARAHRGHRVSPRRGVLKQQAQGQIHGLTTAAGLWLTAAVGVAAGLGREASAVLGTVLAFIILTLLLRVKPPADRDEPPGEGTGGEDS